MFSRIEWKWFFIGSTCILLQNVICAFRTNELIHNDGTTPIKLWSIHSVSAFVAGLFPFRTGEAAFAYLLRKYCTVSGTRAIAILISVRYLEYIFFLIIIFFLSVVGLFISQSKLNISIFIIILINLFIILFVTYKADSSLKYIEKFCNFPLKVFLSKKKMEAFVIKFENFQKNIKSVFQQSISKKMLTMTILVVLFRQAFVLLILRSMGIPISIWLSIFLFAFLYAVKFIQGFGSFGTQESGIAAALILVGYKNEYSMAVAIGTHLLQWIPIIFFGCIGYILLNIKKNHKITG